MRNGTTGLLGGILVLLLVAVAAWWVLNLLFGFVFLIVKLVVLAVILVVAGLFLRGLLTGSREE
jgi:hypothetical protein